MVGLWGTEVGGVPASQFGKREEFAACKLETLVSANLLRAPWFLPKETRRDDASNRTNRPLEGLVWMHFTFREFDLPGNCNVVASDLYVTFVYNGIFFK